MMWKVFFLVTGAVWCIQIFLVHTIRDSACFGTTAICGYYRMSCFNGSRIQVDKLQYGMQQGRCQSTNNTSAKCKEEGIGCCANNSNDCFEDFNQDHAKLVLDNCSGRSSCGPIQAVQTRLIQPHKCSSNFSNYVIVDYSCVNDIIFESGNGVWGTSLLNLGRDLTLIEPEVNVIFDSAENDSIYRNHSINYTCTIVQTGHRNVTLELVDIRLQKPGVAQSCSSVKISIPDANFSAKCSGENKQQNFVYRRRSVIYLNNEGQTKFSIDNMFNLNNRDYPDMIWIKFVAYPPYTVSVTCRDQKIPDDSGGEPQSMLQGRCAEATGMRLLNAVGWIFLMSSISCTADNNTGVIIGVLIPILFLIGVAIIGVVVFRRRHRHILEKKAVLEFQNKARYDELPMAKPKIEVAKSLSNSIYSEIDESKIVNTISATSRECSHCSDQQDDYLEPSNIPEECASRVDSSSSCSQSGFDQNPKDTSGTKSKSDSSVSNTSRVQYVNTVEDKSPKRRKANKIEKLMNPLAFGNKDISAESKTGSSSNDVEAKKTTDKVLKVRRSADDYIEFEHGELYDKPKEPKLVEENDERNKQEKSSNKNNPIVFVYDYADPDGGNTYLPAEEHFMEDNMYEAVDDDHTGFSDDCDKAKEVFTYDYVDEGSTSIKCYHIDSISMGNQNVSCDESYEPIQPPKDVSSSHGAPQIDVSPPTSSSSSLSPVSQPSSSLSSNISTTSPAYVNSPRLRQANKPITASKPNATDGYANSPKLCAGKREPRSSELSGNGEDFKDEGNVVPAVFSVGALKNIFEHQERTNSVADKIESEA